MVSLLHEGVIKLVRDRPAFVADLLDQVLDVKVPSFREAGLVDAVLNQLTPVEYRADAVVLFKNNKKPVYGAIIEAQLKPRLDKRYTWPLYAVGARERHRCPFVVIVVTPDRRTARWAARAIELGGGSQYWPLVVGPDGIPKVTDRRQARREPQLAMLSVMAHGRGEVRTAAAIGGAAARAILRFPEEQWLLYSLLIQANLSKAARKAIEMQPELEIFFSEAQRRNYERGRAKGKAEGKAEAKAEGKAEGLRTAVLKILARRRLTPTAEQRRRIVGCTDLAVLERWLDRSLLVSTVAQLLAEPAPARRNGHRSARAAPSGNGRRK
jgi:hypothetical protein